MAVTLPTFSHRTAHLPDPVAATDRAPWTRLLPRWLGPVALAALLLFVRRPDVWLSPQFFEEDGLFFEQNYHHGWHAIFIPYAGYLHLVIRLVALTAGLLPLALQPAFFNGASLALCLAVIARIFRPGIRLPYKPLLAVAVVLGPRDHYGDILGNLTNIQWFLAFVPVLMLVEDTTPAGWRAAWDLLLLVMVGLSGPFVLFSIPLFALKWFWRARTRWNAACLGTAVFCGAVQAWFIHRHTAAPPIAPTLDQWLTYLAWKFVGPLFFGRELSLRILAPVAAAAVLVGVGAFLIVLNRRRTAWLWPTIVFATVGGTVLLASVSRFLSNPAGAVLLDSSDRYFLLPRVLLIWCLLPHLRVQVGWRHWLLRALLAAVGLAAAADLACRQLPAPGWVEQAGAFERGKTDMLQTYPRWRLFLVRPSARGDGYADVLGAVPLEVVPPEHIAARVSVGGQTFLEPAPGAGAVVYETPPEVRGMSGCYAAAPGTTGAVEFSIVYCPSCGDETEVLWHGRLDPARVPADRGAHEFEIAISPEHLGRLLLCSAPAADETAPSGGCWADIRFR